MYKALSVGAIGHSLSFEQTAQMAAQYGFAGIDMDMKAIESRGVDGVKRILDRNNLIAAVCGMPVEFRQDDETFERGMEALPAFAKAMADVGCTRCATWFMPTYKLATFEEAFEQLCVRTQRICGVLADYGIRYGLEFVGPETSRGDRTKDFIYDINTLLPLIEAVHRPNLGMLLDIWHWYASGDNVADLARLSDDLVVLVHVNDAPAGVRRQDQIDNQRTMPMETGVIDSQAFMAALDEMDYSGPLVVEPFSARVKAMSVEDAIAETSASLDKLLALI